MLTVEVFISILIRVLFMRLKELRASFSHSSCWWVQFPGKLDYIWCVTCSAALIFYSFYSYSSSFSGNIFLKQWVRYKQQCILIWLFCSIKWKTLERKPVWFEYPCKLCLMHLLMKGEELVTETKAPDTSLFPGWCKGKLMWCQENESHHHRAISGTKEPRTTF